MRFRISSIEKANSKTIEYELYNYYNTKKVLIEMKEEILHGKGIAPEVRGIGISKPTEQKALKLLGNLHLLEMEKRIHAIENAMNELPAIKIELLKEKYFFRTLTNYGIMQKLNIEQATFYRYKRDIIELIADKLGWIV